VSCTIDPARLFRWQCSLVAAVILTHVVLGLLGVLAGHDRALGVARLFDVRHEGNVPGDRGDNAGIRLSPLRFREG
jgi:hypothetical protein